MDESSKPIGAWPADLTVDMADLGHVPKKTEDSDSGVELASQPTNSAEEAEAPSEDQSKSLVLYEPPGMGRQKLLSRG